MTSPEQKKYLRKRKINKILVITVQLFILIFFIFLWQYLADKSLINTFITSSPQKVLETILELYQTGNLFNHIYITIYETIVSFLIGTILGIIIAILMYNSPFFSKVIDPYLTILNSLPKVALGPIIISMGRCWNEINNNNGPSHFSYNHNSNRIWRFPKHRSNQNKTIKIP